MKAVLIAAVILILLLFFAALMKVGVIFEYSQEKTDARIRIGPAVIKLRSDKKKTGRKKPDGKKAREKQEKKAGAGNFKENLSIILEIRDKIKRRLVIDELTLWYQSCGEDPADAAMAYGAACAGAGTLLSLISRAFIVKKQDVRISADLEGEKSRLYFKAAISLPLYCLLQGLILYQARRKAAPKINTEVS